MKPFNLSVIEEFDAPSDRPTWRVKLNGETRARVVKTFLSDRQRQRGIVLAKPFVLMTEDFDGDAPWEPSKGAPAFRTAFEAAMHFLRAEVHEDNTEASRSA